MNDKLQPTARSGRTATANWQPNHGDLAVTIYDPSGEPVAVIPLPDVGTAPSHGQLDDLLAVMGFTRTGGWMPRASGGLTSDVVPIREGGTR